MDDPQPTTINPTTSLPASPPPQTPSIPPTLDTGNLLLSHAIPLPPNPPQSLLHQHAQSAAQTLITHLLTTCPITSTPASTSAGSSGIIMHLPPPTTPVPREKPLPKKKEKTTWERFAEKKGIKAKRSAGEGRMVFDEGKGEWRPKWGYGRDKGGEGQWLVEVGEGEEKGENGEGVRGKGRRERKENVRRNERRMRKNERGRRGEGVE